MGSPFFPKRALLLLCMLAWFFATSFLGVSFAIPTASSVHVSLRHDHVQHVPMPVQEPQVQRDLHDLDPPCNPSVELNISSHRESQPRGANATEPSLQAPSTPSSGDQQAASHNRTRVIRSRILGGVPVPTGKFLFATGLRETATGSDFCGGSLITDRHVLTAAHCARRPINYVAVGTHYRSGFKDGVRVAVKSKWIHPNFDADTQAFDLMVLELAERVNTTEYRPVALARSINEGGIATAMGWGRKTEYDEPSAELLQVDLKLQPQEMCHRLLDVDDSMVCAGGEKNKDACQGDSGGPLIMKGSPDVLIGVVSWGDGCGMQGVPGVYARIPVAADWIKAVAPGVAFR